MGRVNLYKFRINYYWILCFIFFLFPVESILSQSTTFEQVSESRGISPIDSFTPIYGNGVSSADFDNDGDVDLYLSTAFGQNDRLYRNDGLGNFEDVGASLGIEEYGTNIASIWFDYDGDTLLDLFILGESCVGSACANPITYSLYKQQLDGSFINTTESAIEDFTGILGSTSLYSVGGLAAGDFDKDNNLDLVICLWSGGLFLLHNNGDGTFSDYTERMNLRTGEAFYWQPLLIDINNDGLLDIYCNVDYSENEAWINQGDSFIEEAKKFGLHNPRHEMGISVSDYNNDGALDMYITNITRDDLGAPKHNLLYQQVNVDNRVYFFEVANDFEVAKSGWDWGTTFIDVNNDGYEDIASTNGWEHGDTESDRSNLWMNLADEFVNISDTCGFNDWYDATTLIKADLDRDGDLDLIQSLKKSSGTNQPLYLYINQLEQKEIQNGYLTIKPRSEFSNYYGIGSQVILDTNKGKKARLITAGTSFYGQEAAEAFYGLASEEEIIKLEVIWPDGIVNYFFDLPKNTDMEVFEEYLMVPTDLSVEDVKEGLLITWTTLIDSSEKVILERSEEENFMLRDTFELPFGQAQFTDMTIENGKRYYYRVSSQGEAAFSPYSKVASGMIQTSSSVDVERIMDISIIPNPAFESVTVEFNDQWDGPLYVHFSTLNGKQILNIEMDIKSNLMSKKLPLPDVPGVYLISIFNHQFSLTKKIIVLN